MNNKVIGLALLTATGCGFAERGSTFVGQLLSVEHHTPLLCDDYWTAHISVGSTLGGSGSQSLETWDVLIPDEEAADGLLTLLGKVGEMRFDERRFSWCTPELEMAPMLRPTALDAPGEGT